MSTLTSNDDLGFLDDIAEPAAERNGVRLRNPENLPDHIRAEYERVNVPVPAVMVAPEVRGSFEDYESSHETVINDDALALELGQKHWDENAKFVASRGNWLFWRGQRWEEADYPVTRGQVRDFLRMKADEVFEWAQRQALDASEDKARAISASAAKVRRTLGAHSTVTAVEQMARSNSKSIAHANSFDGDTLLLGTPGGTVDLKTGKLRPARREDMITKFTAVAPAPSGTPAKVWFDFLRRVFPGDDGYGDLDTIAFIQRAAGYALTGETTEQKLLFLYGTGRNGKGTIMQTLTGILGDYARTVSSSLFMATHGQEHPTGLAQLQGARLVASNEIPKGATWNEEVIKSLTGGDTISARRMRQDFFEFQPQLSLFISGNNKPRFKGVGVSMRERFILVPFSRNFTDDNGQRDPNLGDKLKAEWPAILRWCIDGAGEWLKMGLTPPERVKAASADYLDEEDDILAFVRDCLVPDTEAKTATADIYPAFRKWQEEQGVKSPWTQTAMSRALGEEGNLELKRTRPSGGASSVVNCVVGYRLKSNPDAYSGYRDD
ncbi:phage/plasmid primase, P4 family [Rhizobium sp. IBUN]|uniref:DNA primase family protein n=1 Tax=Rhizobium sp. IBUN TaxID=1042326 RepID=UPI0003FFD013|nr:phage/plasmid primase, P4 family [Rhizobium sp. IBUN]